MSPSSRTSKDNLQDLIDKGIRPQVPQEVLRNEVRTRLAKAKEEGTQYETSLQSLFPNAILDIDVLESLVSSLIAGNHILNFGPSGSGKTVLAKEVLRLMPKPIMVVSDCPVQDNPFSVGDTKFYKRVPCCPFCKQRYGGDVEDFDPSHVEPREVPVRGSRIREGAGFARIQGSAEVFPDNLTGTINIRKLEEVGDPTSPMVLQPGKLLQANRGVLIADEVGKLPLGTQNVLLQALQESIVTPAKSRETFPASFITISTSNITDLDNINEPLNDRLSNIYVGFTRSHAGNRLISQMGGANAMMQVFYPDVIFDAGVRLIESWRLATGELYELSEVGSNRTLIDIVTRVVAYTQMQGRSIVTTKDFRNGVKKAMLSHIRARGGDSYGRDKEAVESFLNERLKKDLNAAADTYWCKFFEEDLGGKKDVSAKVIADAHEVINGRPGGKEWLLFMDHVSRMERFKGRLGQEALAKRVFKILRRAGIFGDLK